MASRTQLFFQTLFRTVVADAQQRLPDLAKKGIPELLCLVIDQAVRAALGPVAIVVPRSSVVLKYSVLMVRKTLADLPARDERRFLAGGLYRTRQTASNLVVAELDSAQASPTSTIALPKKISIELPNPRKRQALLTDFGRIGGRAANGEKVFRRLQSVGPRRFCKACSRTISVYGTVELGHAWNCSAKPALGRDATQQVVSRIGASKPKAAGLNLRFQRDCLFCGQRLYGAGVQVKGHAAGCPLNPARYGGLDVKRRATSTLARRSSHDRLEAILARGRAQLLQSDGGQKKGGYFVCPKCGLRFKRQSEFEKHKKNRFLHS